MIRLRPSEITLTPADVEQTRRRIASRKQSNLPRPSVSTGASRAHQSQIVGPRLRRGPEHSRDDALRRLGNIPVLKPCLAVHSSTEGDSDSSQAQSAQVCTEDAEADSNSTPSGVHPKNEQHPSPRAATATVTAAAAAAGPEEPPSMSSHVRLLPFRPALGDGTVSDDANQTPRWLARAGDPDEEFSALTPRNRRGALELSHTGALRSEGDINTMSQARLLDSTDGFIEPASALSPSSSIQFSNRLHPDLEQNNSVPDQGGIAASPRRNVDDNLGRHQSDVVPALHLQGYFMSPERYTFRMMPHTEPRQRPPQRAQRARPASSHSETPRLISSSMGGRFQSSSGEEDFWTAPTTEIPGYIDRHDASSVGESMRSRRRPSLDQRVRSRAHSLSESLQERYRDFFGRARAHDADHSDPSPGPHTRRYAAQRFSETSSNSSLPYSYYELPASRQSSSNQSYDVGHLPHSQYDGAAPSRQVSHGGHLSISPSEARAANESRLRPAPTRVSSFSSPNLTVPDSLSQRGVSPLPASPYTRMRSANSTPRPSTGLISANDFVGGDREAAIAARRDLSSPLDLLEQRAAFYASQLSSEGNHTSLRSGSGAPSNFQYQIEDFDDDHPPYTRPSGPRIVPGNVVDSPFTRLASRRTSTMQRLSQRRSERQAGDNRASQVQRGIVPAARTGQRSSENVPMDVSTHEDYLELRTVQRRGNQGGTRQLEPMQTGTFRRDEMQASLAPFRFSVPPRPVARNPSIAPQIRSRHGVSTTISATTTQHDNDEMYNLSLGSPYQTQRPDTPGIPPIPPVRRSSRNQPGLGLSNLEGGRVQPNQARPSSGNNTQDERQRARLDNRSFLSARLLTIAGNRRVQLTRAETSRRRVPPEQQNQENSGEAEWEMMDAELQVVGMRHGDEGQLDTMDETPPRLGRFEQHMLGN